MSRPTCSQLRSQLKAIKELKIEFDLELQKIKDTRDTAPSLRLEKEIIDKIEAIKESFFYIFLEKQRREAENMFGQDFLGPDQVSKAFNVKLQLESIPVIPFSKEELERAKELGQFLILRIDKAPDGEPLTMKKMHDIIYQKTSFNDQKIFFNNAYFCSSSFYTGGNGNQPVDFSLPNFGWALVSKDLIPNSTSKTYLEQTEEIVKYLEEEVFKDQLMPLEYQEAIDEFNLNKDQLKRLLHDDMLKVGGGAKSAMEISKLKLNKLIRQNPSELLYDLWVYLQNNDIKLLEGKFVRTYVTQGDLRFCLSGFSRYGMSDEVHYDSWGSRNNGVVFSRKF